MVKHLADLYEGDARAVVMTNAVVERIERRSYTELLARTNVLAHGLTSLGVRRGEHVGLCLRNTLEHLEAMLACYQCGAVPINVNWRYSADELAYLFEDAGTVLVAHGAEFGDAVRAAAARVDAVRATLAVPGPEYERLVATIGDVGGLPPRSGDDRYVLYTRGTTGR